VRRTEDRGLRTQDPTGGLAMLVAAIVLSMVGKVGAAEPLRHALFADGFEGPVRPCWQVYDNWSKAELRQVPSPFEGRGKALQVELDDKSTEAWLDKGFLLVLDERIPWKRLDYVEVSYLIDQPVANIRCFVAEDDGEWWDFTDSKPAIGAPGKLRVRRDDFRFAWADGKTTVHAKDQAVHRVFFSIHNVDPVSSGHRFVFTIDDVEIATELCAEPYRVSSDDVLQDVVVAPRSSASGTAIRTAAPAALHWGAQGLQGMIWAVWDDTGIRVAVENCGSLLLPGTIKLAVGGREPIALAYGGQNVLLGEMKAGPDLELWDGQALPIEMADSPVSTVRKTLLLVRELDATEIAAVSARLGGAMLYPNRRPFTLAESAVCSLQLPLALPGVRAPQELRGPEGIVWTRQEPVEGMKLSPFRQLTYAANRTPPPGHHRVSAVLAVEGGEPVTLEASFDATEIEVADMRRALPEARKKLEALAARAAGRDRPRSWSREGLAATPEVRVRERVDPAKWSLIKDPVTWDDLGGDYVGGTQCGINREDLDLHFGHYGFGRAIKPHLGYFLNETWRQNLEECKRRNLIVMSVWGYVPDEKWNGGFGDTTIPPEQHQQILDTMGRQFLGYEMGEQDGRYVGSYAPRYQPETRAEARKLFDDWHENIQAHLNHFMVALGSLNFSHYYAEENHRILGLETAQGLPSDILEWAFLRGASRQYGALTWNCISVFNRWGYKSYTGTGPDHGPDKGTSVSLMRRLYYTTYMYGSGTNSFESSYFLSEKDAEGFPKLSPIGEANVEAVRWCREHPRRGVPYSPVAIMLDRDAGWVPPRHLYTSARHLVWGNLPYSKGDHATDALFRMVFPQYEDCSYYEDERGYLTETPCGDQFEVLLSNAEPRVLASYKAIVIPGDVAMDAGTIERLSEFVRGGGGLFLDAAHAAALPANVSGVKVAAERRTAQMSLLLPTGEQIEEVPYVYRLVEPAEARVLAVTEAGDPLITVHEHGKGRVIVIAAENLVSAQWQDPEDKRDVPLQHRLLRVVERILTGYFRDLALVAVEPGGIQCLVNVTDNPDELIVTLVNNGQSEWKGTATPKTGGNWRSEGWLPASPETLAPKLEVTLPAGELAICRLRR
jgi:hypothetical protein